MVGALRGGGGEPSGAGPAEGTGPGGGAGKETRAGGVAWVGGVWASRPGVGPATPRRVRSREQGGRKT